MTEEKPSLGHDRKEGRLLYSCVDADLVIVFGTLLENWGKTCRCSSL